MQGFYWMFIHGAERGYDHAEGDDGEKEQTLDEGYDEEMRPELRYPVPLKTRAAVGAAVGEHVPLDGELKPNDAADQACKEGENGSLAPDLEKDVVALGSEAAHDADVLGALAYLQPEGAERAEDDDDGEEHEGDGGQRSVQHRVVVGHLFVVVLLIGFETA